MDDADVAILTTQMSRGDRAAVERFYRAYFDALLSMSRRAAGGGKLSRDEAFCLDVVHDAVLRIVRCVRPVPAHDAGKRFRAWLRLVVQSCALDRLRAEQRRRHRERSSAAGETVDLSGYNGEVEERSEWLRAQIDRLDPALARLIELRYDRGWTLARVAAAAGGTIGGIDGRLRRAIAVLRDRAVVEFGED